MAGVVDVVKHAACDDLSGYSVLTLGLFKLRKSAIFNPAAHQSSHQGGGIPGGCPDDALQLGYPLLG